MKQSSPTIHANIYKATLSFDEIGTLSRYHQDIKLKSLIMAQIERWRQALHMQVERKRTGACSRGVERAGRVSKRVGKSTS